jgi:LysM repeat protein
MRRFFFYFFVGMLIPVMSACLVSNNETTSGTEALTALSCQQVANNAGTSLTCIPTDAGGLFLAANPGTQITLNTQDAEVTFDEEMHWMADNNQMTISAIAGAVAIRAGQSTRVVPAGQSAVLTLRGEDLRTVGPPSNPTVTDPALLALLPDRDRPTATTTQAPAVATNTPATAVTAATTTAPQDNTVLRPVEVNTSPTPTNSIIDPEGECLVTPPEWTLTYEVQPGDTLTRISVEYDVALPDLIEGNCITNPDQLALGQVLQLPDDNPPTITPQPAFTTGLLQAERDVIVAGDCVILSWDVPDAQAASLDGQAVTVSGEEAVCPAATKNYALRVTYADGSQDVANVLITVTG